MGGDAKATRLTYLAQYFQYSAKYIKDALNLPKVTEQSLGTGR